MIMQKYALMTDLNSKWQPHIHLAVLADLSLTFKIGHDFKLIFMKTCHLPNALFKIHGLQK